MPYIKQEFRDKVDPIIHCLLGAFNVPDYRIDGVVNYIITHFLNDVYDTNYSDIVRVIGVLETVKQEYYRRVVAPYEDAKMKEQGDVYR